MVFPARAIQLFIVSALAALFFLFPLAAHAYTPSQATYLPNTNPDVPRNEHTRTQVVVIEVLSAVVCQLAGIDPIDPTMPCLGIDPTTRKIGYVQNTSEDGSPRVGGMIGTVTNLIGMTYVIPVSGSEYTRYLASNFGVTKTAYAQETSIGFTGLQPILGLWTRLRDLTYLGFVVLFVLIGLGIMLRVRVDPRTVMTIQNQIPKVIISILLITFSYAIAGFMIDVMWLSTYVGINVLTSEDLCPGAGSLTAKATNGLLDNPIAYTWNLFKDNGCAVNAGLPELSYNIGQSIGDVVTNLIFSALRIPDNAPDCSTWSAVSGNWGDCILRGFFNALSWILGIAAMVVVLMAMLVQLFRVWFMLIKSYIYVLFHTIVAPFSIFLGLIPGNSFGFESWLRHLISALAVFPVTVFLFVVATILANEPLINQLDANGQALRGTPDVFIPPLVGNPDIAHNLGMIIAFGVILVAPQVTQMMSDAFKASPTKYSAELYKGIGRGMSASEDVTAPLKYMWRDPNAQAGDEGGILKKALFGRPAAGTGPGGIPIYNYASSKPWQKALRTAFKVVGGGK